MKYLMSVLGMFCFLMLFGCVGSQNIGEQRQAARNNFYALTVEEKESLIQRLIESADRGKNEEVRQLLERGVPPDAVVRGWSPALIRASIRENLDVMSLLIDYGADVNVQNEEGFTALMVAIVNDKPKSVDLFLNKHKANINVRKSDGMTALDVAYLHARDEYIRLLTEAGGTTEYLKLEAWKRIHSDPVKRRKKNKSNSEPNE